MRSELLAALLCAAAPSFAQDAVDPKAMPRMTLIEFMKAAETTGHQLGEQRARVEFSEARENEAFSKALPSGTIDAAISPLPGATGDALNGREHWDRLTYVLATRFEIILPLYTFGSVSAGRRAARAGTAAEKLLLERDRWQLRSEVSQLYFGYQLGFELSELVADIKEKLMLAIKEGEKLRKGGKKGAPSEEDLNKLRVVVAEVKVREAEAKKGMLQARLGMAWKIGTYGISTPRWDHANLVKRDFKTVDLGRYQVMAFETRPEVQALKENVAAREALVDVEWGQQFPALFVMGQGQIATSPGRQEQQSPFANDPANSSSGGIFLGMRWDFGIFERRAKLGQARAALHEAQAKLRHLEAGIYAEVEKKFLDHQFASEAVGLRSEAAETAKKLYRDNVAGFVLGSTSARNLLEALGSYVSGEKSRLEAIFAYNTSVNELEQVVGQKLIEN